MAKTPKRIGVELLDQDLKDLINSGAKLFPITQENVDTNTNPNNVEWGYVTDGTRKVIYAWAIDHWEMAGADDLEIYWTEILNKPTAFPPVAHSHAITDVTNLQTTLDGKSDVGHTHAQLHDHSNKATLDKVGYTGASASLDLKDMEDNTASRHSHSNKSVLDKVTESISDPSYDLHLINDHEQRLSAIEGGYSEGHTHGNLTTLDLLSYSGSKQTIDLINIENNTATLSTKADKTTLDGHINNSVVHVTQTDKDTWNSKADGAHIHVEADITDLGDYMPQSGGTFTGDVSIQGLLNLLAQTSGDVLLRLSHPTSPTQAGYEVRFSADDFYIEHYTQYSGSYIKSFDVKRQDGQVTFNTTPNVGTDKVWHAGNDGSGSSLDADLLDGKHADEFTPAVSATQPSNGASMWYKVVG